MNTTLSATDMVTVRKALASAIDRNHILTDVLGTPWAEPATSVIPPTVNGYQNGAVGYNYNLAQAQAYLTTAGYPGGAGFPGIELWANYGTEAAIDAVADQWRTNLSISVTTYYTDWYPYLDLFSGCPVSGHCSYNAYRLGWAMDYPDANNMLNDLFHPYSGNQYTGWDNARYRQLISMTLTETNQISRTSYFQEADRILVEDDVAIIPIFFYDSQNLVKSDVLPEFVPFYGPHYKNWRLTTAVTATVTSSGGSISAPDGDVEVEFPPGAVPGTAIVTYTSFYVSPHPPTGTFSFAGNAFQLEVTDLGSGDSITEFVVPLTITIHYNDGDLNGIDESSLELMYWNGSAWVTDGITIVQHDMVNNILIIQIDHLTELALFGIRRVYLPMIMRGW
jgi:ABC-type transport system substrate-binding protein